MGIYAPYTKVWRQPPIGELHPLQVPEAHWDTLSVDFIVELPEAHGFEAVMNVVDSVSKHAHFIPTNTAITAAGAARLFLHHVWKLHGLPWVVVSDRGVQFVHEFTHELYRLLDICIAASTAYTPRQMARPNVSTKSWSSTFASSWMKGKMIGDDLLPMAEFQYNNHVHSSTHQTPFMLDTGQHPHIGFEPHQNPSHIESVNELKEQMEESLSEAKLALAKSKEDMECYYNWHHMPAPIFTPGDKVYLDASDIQSTCPSKKLAHWRLGPYIVEHQVGSHAYCYKFILIFKNVTAKIMFYWGCCLYVALN